MKNKKTGKQTELLLADIAAGGVVSATSADVKELKIKGLAIVYEQEGDIGAGHCEVIKRGAARNALTRGENTFLLWNHDRSLPLASVKSGTLKLKETDEGVEIEARIPNTQAGRDYYTMIQDGIVNTMSFNLVTSKDTWQRRNGKLVHVVNEIDKIPEVSITAFAAFRGTEVCTRSLPELEEEIVIEEKKEALETAAEIKTIPSEENKTHELTNGGKTMNTTEEINKRLAEITETQAAILKAVEQRKAEGGDAALTEEEKKQYDAMATEIKELEARALVLADVELKKEEVQNRSTKLAGIKSAQVIPFATTGTAPNEGANRSAIGVGVNLNISEEARVVSQSLIPEHSEYAEKFSRYLVTGSLVEEGELRTLSKTQQGGGVVIPMNMFNRVIPMLANASALRKVAQMHRGERLNTMMVEGQIAGGEVTAEGAKINADTNTLFTDKKLEYTKFTYLLETTTELKEDATSNISLEDWIMKRAANVLAAKEEREHLSAAKGIVSQVKMVREIADKTKFNTDALIEMQDELDPPYRNNTSWVMAKEALTAIRLMKDTTLRPLYDEALEMAPRQGLLGAPLHVTAGLPKFGAGNTVALYGDFSYTLLSIARQFTVQVNPYLRAENDITQYFFSMRSSAVLTHEGTLVALKTKA